MSAGQLAGAVLGGFGLGCVAMQFMQASSADAPDVKGSKLKKTLTNAGLYPTPEVDADGKRKPLKSTPSGSMAVFASGAAPGAALNKAGGDAM